MTVIEERLWCCDSCTQQERAPRIHSIEHVEAPDGWMRAVLLMKTGDPVTQWWCRNCVDTLAKALPNALGALSPTPLLGVAVEVPKYPGWSGKGAHPGHHLVADDGGMGECSCRVWVPLY